MLTQSHAFKINSLLQMYNSTLNLNDFSVLQNVKKVFAGHGNTVRKGWTTNLMYIWVCDQLKSD